MKPLVTIILVLLFASVASATTYTVCATGCGDYTTIQGAVNVCSSGDIVEILDSSQYNEQISRTVTSITIRAAAGQTPIIDGQNTRTNGILAYTGWVIRGLTVRNTTGDAIRGNASNRQFDVYGCTIHDAGGVGIGSISSTSYVEDTIIHDVGSNGILSTGVVSVLNCVVYAYGATAIQVTGATAAVKHCTVYGGTGGTYCIQVTGASGVAMFNALQGCHATAAGLRFGGASFYNNVYGTIGGGTNYYLGTMGTGDMSVDGLLVDPPNDFHPAKGSPLIDGTGGVSTTPTDVTGVERVGLPDIGAYEYIAAVARPFANGIGQVFEGGNINQCYSDGF